jgi:hypothetical protein
VSSLSVVTIPTGPLFTPPAHPLFVP